jgi:hypothetical protein
MSVFLSVCPSAWNNSAPTGWIFMKFDIWGFFENVARKFKFEKNLTRLLDTLHVLYILCSIHFFFSENCTFYEIMWRILVQPDWLHMTV